MSGFIIGVLGCGVIGSAVTDGFTERAFDVRVHDIKLSSSMTDLLLCDVIFVCLPTPMLPDGGCDVSIVESELGQLHKLGFRGLVCIKSTVEPGTARELDSKYSELAITNCPEFLRERSALEDFLDYGLCIIGNDGEHKYSELLMKIHEPFTRKFKIVSLTEAEIIKYFHNTYNALRVVFANSFFDLSGFMNANYDEVLDAICERNSFSSDYLKCGENVRGFSGPCLPKDTKALAKFSEKNGLNLDIWKFILKENDKFEKTTFEGMREY